MGFAVCGVTISLGVSDYNLAMKPTGSWVGRALVRVMDLACEHDEFPRGRGYEPHC